MTKSDLIKDMEYVENKRSHLACMIRNRQSFTYDELTRTLYGLTGALYHILDDMRIQKDKGREFQITEKEFEEMFCKLCGTQRCEGVDSEWFEGCKHKDKLKQD